MASFWRLTSQTLQRRDAEEEENEKLVARLAFRGLRDIKASWSGPYPSYILHCIVRYLPLVCLTYLPTYSANPKHP